MKIALAFVAALLSSACAHNSAPLHAAAATELAQWRQTIAPCLASLAPGALPNLPEAPHQLLAELHIPQLTPLHHNPLVSDGYEHRLAWRPGDGALYVVSQGGLAGNTRLFGPLREGWCRLRSPVRGIA
jgi:hypothetical protein